jgi:hypothetical protein
MEYKYIHFAEIHNTGKTSVWSCRNNKSGEELGQVKWHGPWRRYCYFPSCPAVYSTGCLKDIEDFIEHIAGKRDPK